MLPDPFSATATRELGDTREEKRGGSGWVKGQEGGEDRALK